MGLGTGRAGAGVRAASVANHCQHYTCVIDVPPYPDVRVGVVETWGNAEGNLAQTHGGK